MQPVPHLHRALSLLVKHFLNDVNYDVYTR